jgi:hypothetical protein
MLSMRKWLNTQQKTTNAADGVGLRRIDWPFWYLIQIPNCLRITRREKMPPR